MRGCLTVSKSDDVVRDTYRPEQDRSLTDALVDGIEACKGEALQRTDFALFEDLDQHALEHLVRLDAEPRTSVTFETDEVRIELWGDGGVEIEIEDLAAE